MRYVRIPTLVKKEREELNAAKRASKATAPGDAARRNILQQAAVAKSDS